MEVTSQLSSQNKGCEVLALAIYSPRFFMPSFIVLNYEVAKQQALAISENQAVFFCFDLGTAR